MYLSKPDIIACLNEGSLVIDPRPHDDDIEQVSVDLRLARTLRRFTSNPL